MASMFRSQFRHAPQGDGPSSQSQKNSSNRSTKGPSSEDIDSRPSKSTQHVSRLTKRSSKSITPIEKDVQDTRAAGRTPGTVTAAPEPVVRPKRMSVTPSGMSEYGNAAPRTRSNTSLQPPTVPTPSMVSGTTISTNESPRSSFLRRKPSSIQRHVASQRTDARAMSGLKMTSPQSELDEHDTFENTVLGIAMPTTTQSFRPSSTISTDVPLADQYLARKYTPPVYGYAPSSTPSTRYTDSPFSHVPTPSSASSYSSSILAPAVNKTPRTNQPSPTPLTTPRTSERTETSRRGLPPVRESSTSSSSSVSKRSSSRPAVPTKDVPRKSTTVPPPGTNDEASRPSSRGRLVKDRPKKVAPKTELKMVPAIPPELAHLNIEPPSKPALNKALPPLRPSRDGTPHLADVSQPAVVQSDLPKLYTTYHKRTPSQETPSSPGLRSRFGISSRSSSRQESPRIDSAVSPPQAARSFKRDPTPEPARPDTRTVARKDSPAIASSPSKSPFSGFFTRKPKEMTKPPKKPDRGARKGPAAGTGHEGYGRFGFRGRSGSTTSSNGVRSSSTDSNGSTQTARTATSRQDSVGTKDGSELDDFLKERLTPVYLRGSGSTFSAERSSVDAPTQSTQPSSKTSSMDSSQTPQLLPSAMSHNAGMSPAKPLQAFRDSGESPYTGPATFAAREQQQQAALSAGPPSATRTVPRINTKLSTHFLASDGEEHQEMTASPVDHRLPTRSALDEKEGLWLRPRPEDPSAKQTRKFNFFQRAQASPRAKGKEKQHAETYPPHTAVRQSRERGEPEYTILGSIAKVDLDEVERIAQESLATTDDSASETVRVPKLVAYGQRHSGLLPSPPKPDFSRDSDFKARPLPPRITIRPDSKEGGEAMHRKPAVLTMSPVLADIERMLLVPEPEIDPSWDQQPAKQQAMPPPRSELRTPDMPQVPFNTPEKNDQSGSPRQPRLSPVGRIPKVVSKRDRDRKLSDNSFSRPFVRTQPRPTVKPPGSLYNEIRELASPVEPSSATFPVSSTSTNSNGGSGDSKSGVEFPAPSASTARTSMDMHADPEFFAYPRKDSDVSCTTSSGHNSYLAPLWLYPVPTDEVWHEYNDLMDDVLNHTTPLSTGSSLGAPFQYSNALQNSVPGVGPPPLYWSPPPATQLPSIPRPGTTPAVLSVPQQISRFMQPSMSPLAPPTPQTLADFYDQYGNPSMTRFSTADRSSIPSFFYRSSQAGLEDALTAATPQRSSLPRSVNRSSLPGARASMSSSRYSRASAHSRANSLLEANIRNSQSSLGPGSRINRNTQLLDIAEVDGDEQAAAANIRWASLMSAKWLSNGRVLFSPAHNEMRLADTPRVLVIDGLGSDWSFYCALSYPDALVYNLGPSSSASWPGVRQMPPQNHRHIFHSSISAVFPFPKGFFAAVVFRFPVATNSETIHACVTECKRVLRPGGHLEVTTVDLDLNCMGNKARKAVRDLKTRMQLQDPSIDLSNASDYMLRVIGRKGFEEVQRCIVGVPASGCIPRSQDVSSRSSRDSGSKSVWQRESRSSQEFSFADLLEDARANQTQADTRKNDEGITKTVAKVGRSWYTQCYEQGLQHTNHGIWQDQALLRECQKQGTSFRLLICHAQKPTQTRRRTVSV